MGPVLPAPHGGERPRRLKLRGTQHNLDVAGCDSAARCGGPPVRQCAWPPSKPRETARAGGKLPRIR